MRRVPGLLSINAQDESRYFDSKKAPPRSGDGSSSSAHRGVVFRLVLTRWLKMLEHCSPCPNALHLAEVLPVVEHRVSKLCIAEMVFEVDPGSPSLGVA